MECVCWRFFTTFVYKLFYIICMFLSYTFFLRLPFILYLPFLFYFFHLSRVIYMTFFFFHVVSACFSPANILPSFPFSIFCTLRYRLTLTISFLSLIFPPPLFCFSIILPHFPLYRLSLLPPTFSSQLFLYKSSLAFPNLFSVHFSLSISLIRCLSITFSDLVYFSLVFNYFYPLH